MHKVVQAKILKQIENYQKKCKQTQSLVEFKPDDIVWIHLRNDWFPSRKYAKLKLRENGPLKVLQRIGENAYKIELPENYGVSNTFNVADLSRYDGENSTSDSRASLLQPGELDTGVSHIFATKEFSDSFATLHENGHNIF